MDKKLTDASAMASLVARGHELIRKARESEEARKTLRESGESGTASQEARKPDLVPASAKVLAGATTKDRIIQIAAKHGGNIKGKDIADILGVSPSYVSEVISENLAEIASLGIVAPAAKEIQRAERLEEVQDLLIKRFSEEVAPTLRGKDILPAISALSKIPRYQPKPVGLNPLSGEGGSDIVHIQLPQIAINNFNLANFQVDSNNRIVSHEGRTLMAATASQVKEMAAEAVPELKELEGMNDGDRSGVFAVDAIAKEFSNTRIGGSASGISGSDLGALEFE